MNVQELGGFSLQVGIYRRAQNSLRVDSEPRAGTEAEKTKKVAEEFAALLFSEVIKAMRATIPKGGLFEEDSMAHDLYTSLADMEIARVMAKREWGGLTGIVERMLGEPEKSAGINPDPTFIGTGNHFLRPPDQSRRLWVP